MDGWVDGWMDGWYRRVVRRRGQNFQLKLTKFKIENSEMKKILFIFKFRGIFLGTIVMNIC